MDNDNALLQKARNLYKGLRFGIKYRGVPILSAEEGNDAAAVALAKDNPAPYLFARCGATEMRTVAEYMKNGGHGFSDKIKREIRDLSGVFPPEDETLARFCKLYLENIREADMLALWDVGAEREAIRGCDATTKYCTLRGLEPYYHPHPWSAALAGQRVLVVHPFKKTIHDQYDRRELLFPGTEVLPEFASLKVIRAVQGLAGQNTGFATWFDALHAMQVQMDEVEYDIAIIGAGAYGLPLAAHAKATGHKAVQMSGATQLLFGIRGKRWDDHPQISALYNDAWVRPDATETLAHSEKVEGGSYW